MTSALATYFGPSRYSWLDRMTGSSSREQLHCDVWHPRCTGSATHIKERPKVLLVPSDSTILVKSEVTSRTLEHFLVCGQAGEQGSTPIRLGATAHML
jgi:hypothetical protein